MNFETVIFDFGNVFTIWDPFIAIGDRYSSADYEQFKRDVDFDTLVEQWDGGDSHAETLAKIVAKDKLLGTNWAALYEYYLPQFDKTIANYISGMRELVEELQANGIKTYGLTNWAYEDIGTAKAVVPAIALMQGIVVSAEEKVTKPNPRIYEILLERYQIDPKTAIFIDDREVNIVAAEQFGITGYLNLPPFENTATNFRKFLVEKGVLK
jgi:epoxide hydrolase-like predicted phosphatase